MKKLLFFAPLLCILAACSNDFEVTSAWKDIPVVYAMLSPADTAHYVRVEKGFLDPDKGATEVARIADSLYYPENEIRVFIVRVNTKERMPLVRVDGEKEGIPRKPGIFATSPNWLYKLPNNGKIVAGERYRLEIERQDGAPTVFARTKIPASSRFLDPNPADNPRLFSLKDTLGVSLQWRADTFGLYNNLRWKIRYQEQDANGNVLARRTIEWNPIVNLRRSEIAGPDFVVRTSIPQSRFFKLLSDSIPPIQTGRFRYFQLGEIIVESGGYEISKLLDVLSVAGGLTGAEVIPTYSNISEGYGIFTSKNVTVLGDVKITPETVVAMNRNSLTRPLGFSN